MDKMNGKSMDLIAENVSRLKALFPEVFTEDKIDFEKLQEILGEHIEDKDERYRFEWKGKLKAIRLAQIPSTGTLRPSRKESKNWETTENIYIEGDNLEVLKLLQKTYFNRIKMIYLDPPYNTGKDFVYADNYKDTLKNYLEMTGQVDMHGRKMGTNTEDSGRYHTDWLNMMYPRLRLAKNLLRDDGVIFISIDDNEMENLKKICNEIFGEANFLGTFIIKSTPNARDYGHIGKMHEFVLFYGKNSNQTVTNMLKDETKRFSYEDEVGGFNIHPLYNSNVAFNKLNRPNLYYPFYLNPTPKHDGFYEIGLVKREGWIEIYPPSSVKDNVQFVWRWGRQKAQENLNKEIIGYKTSDEYRIVQKMRNSEKIIRSILDDKEFSSRRGTAEVENIFEKKIFSFPKPLKLLETLCLVGAGEEDIILDFFSGSSTTAHAIMNLNAQDGGNRKYIMIQLPELIDEKSEAYKAGYKNICQIGRERIHRAGEKLIQEYNGTEGIKNLDIGFKVFKLDSSNLKRWTPNYDELEGTLEDMIYNFVEGRTEEDVLYEIMLKFGIDLTYKIEVIEIYGKKVFNIGLGSLIVCLDNDITLEVIEGLVRLKNELDSEVTRIVLKDNGFKDDSIKTNALQILTRNNIEDVMSI